VTGGSGSFFSSLGPAYLVRILIVIVMQILSVKSQNALSGVQQNLREGDFVFARVLRNLGGGNYLVSFAGGRFAAKSAQNLVQGQTFRAQISLAGGSVALKIVPSAAGQGGENMAKAFEALSPETSDFLAALGLPVDGVSAKILQAMTQSGSKIDARLMQRIRRAAQKFKGREAEAAEAALALEEKGVDSESAALDEIMDALGGREGSEAGSRQDGQKDSGQKDGGQNAQGQDGSDAGASGDEAFGRESEGADYERILGEVKRFFDVFGGLQFEGGGGFSASSFSEEKAGALALFNHLRGGGSSTHEKQKGWLFFPFEYKIAARNNGGENGNGALRLYLDYENASVEKMLINFKSICANVFFALYFKNKKVEKLVVSSQDKSALQEMKLESLRSLADSIGQGVKLELLDFEKFSTFGTEDLPFFGVEGFA
jgi:hypothetical protein